jgi:urease accessory protein
MKRILTSALMLLPTPLLAHGLHEEGTLLGGALHPVGGADHVLAMIAVGLLAAQLSGKSLWALPGAFVAAMVAGGALGAGGIPFPAVEPMILSSIIVLGVLVALATRLPLAALVPLVAVFGLAHGWAHGAEGPATGMAAYAVGFAVATAILHFSGIAIGRALPRLALRGLGAGAALAGLALVVAG